MRPIKALFVAVMILAGLGRANPASGWSIVGTAIDSLGQAEAQIAFILEPGALVLLVLLLGAVPFRRIR
jgi:hypothetical protein